MVRYYLIEFADGSVTRSADPWARAAGANGRRSMVVDLSRTDPDGWDADRRPTTPISSDVIWETHIGDFSNAQSSGVPAEHRGKYLAFTDSGTTLNGEGAFPTCVEYLKNLGITVVQLLPFYDAQAGTTGGTIRSTTTFPKVPTPRIRMMARCASANARPWSRRCMRPASQW